MAKTGCGLKQRAEATPGGKAKAVEHSKSAEAEKRKST